ncbi:MAG: YcaO-like family protein [Maritimibacter sp.]|nr:YcaO-like family protein [Maritimibacter sp.]
MAADALLPGLAPCAQALQGIGLAPGDADALLRRMGVTRLAAATGLDNLSVPVWSGIRPASRSLAVSFGKGLSAAQAQISAIMETLENAFAEASATKVARTASLADMRAAGERIVPLETLSRCDPAGLDQTVPVRWIAGRSARSGQTAFAPLELVGLDYTDSAAQAWCIRASIGLAAHTDRDGAVRHGLLELLEHDAMAQVDRLPGFPAILPVLPLEEAPDEVRAALERTGLDAARPRFHLVPTRRGVCTVLCSILRQGATGTADHGRCFGVATRFDGAGAAIAALVEAAQVRMTLITGAREDLEAHHYASSGRAAPDLAQVPASWGAVRAAPGGDADRTAAHDVAELLALVDAEPYVFELSDPTDPVTVVRVLAPGLVSGLDESRSLGLGALSVLFGLAGGAGG